MGVYYQPPPPFMGGGQPHAARELPPSLTAVQVDPPPSTLGGPRALIFEGFQVNWSDWSSAAWPYIFVSVSGQPYGQRKLAPRIPGQSVDNPPFTLGGPVALKAESVAIAQPDPWTYSFIGSAQPFGPRCLSSAIPGQSADAPPSTLGGPRALLLELAAVNWPEWSFTNWPFVFMGERQPYAPRKIMPGVPGQSIDNPPFSQTGSVDSIYATLYSVAQPDPWFYTFVGGRQPYDTRKLSPRITNVSVDEPPYTLGGPYALKAEIVSANQSDWSSAAWPFYFVGGRQPYAPRTLPPSASAVPVSVVSFSNRSRTQAFLAIRDAWNPPPPDFQMKLYESSITPPRIRPTARGYIIF